MYLHTPHEQWLHRLCRAVLGFFAWSAVPREIAARLTAIFPASCI